jgi:hypothetical protein
MFFQRLLIIPCLWVGCLPASFAQSLPAGSPLDSLLGMQMNWDASRTDDHAKPVMTLTFVPFEHHQQDGKSFTSYYVYAAGVPQNTPYVLLAWQIGWGADLPPFTPQYTDIYVNGRGVVMCRKPTETEINSDAPALNSDARLEVIAAGALGEPARYALLDAKQSFVAMGRVIVNPIQATDKTCHLQAILAVGGGEIVLAEGTGFTANTKVELTREISGKMQTATFRTDANGRLETAAFLISKGQTQGTATLAMKSDACAPSVTFNWGRDKYKVQ